MLQVLWNKLISGNLSDMFYRCICELQATLNEACVKCSNQALDYATHYGAWHTLCCVVSTSHSHLPVSFWVYYSYIQWLLEHVVRIYRLFYSQQVKTLKFFLPLYLVNVKRLSSLFLSLIENLIPAMKKVCTLNSYYLYEWRIHVNP